MLGDRWTHLGVGVEKDPQLSHYWLIQGAEAGHAISQYNLGVRYQVGTEVVTSDMTEAVKWYTKASDSGDSDADVLIADIYDNGNGNVAKDEKKILEW
jgi:TPR repeat protein